MTHAVSATFTRFEHMSPTAAAMAAALHVLTALAIWYVSPLHQKDQPEEAIEVTIEQPAPEQAKPEPPPPPAPPPAQITPPAALAVPSPPAAPVPPVTQGPRPQPRTAPAPAGQLGMSQPSPTTPEPPKPEPPSAPQQALAPRVETPPPPDLEKALPPLDAPPPPITGHDFPKPPPPAPPQRAHATPPPPAAHPPQTPAPSPLQQAPHQAPPNSQATAPSATFVNPSETRARAKVQEEYFWQVIRKMSQYLPNLREKNEGGSVTVRLVIARDGRLLDVSIARSSGVTTLDRGMIESARAASPYPPLPPEIPGNQVVFTQEITAKR